MKRYNLLGTDVVAAIVLAGTALLLFGESFRRGVDPGTLGLGAATLGLFVMLGSPWQFQPTRRRNNLPALAVFSLGVVVGLASDLLLPISIAWSALLWAWLSARLSDEALPRIRRLLLLTLLIFPWADIDIKPIHWAMRISAAGVSQHLLTWVGLPTTREGAMLCVAGQNVEISKDCAGGETLHAMLVVGLASAYVYLDRRQSILAWLPALCVFAWVANTLRVLLIALAVGCFPGSRYVDWVHDGGGLLVVALMLALCIACFAGWKRFGSSFQSFRSGSAEASWPNRLPLRYLRGEGAFTRVALWSLLVVSVAVGTLWRMFPLPDARERLRQLPTVCEGRPSRDVALTETEIRWLGDAQAVKRVYRFGGRDFLVIAIDGTRNRRAVHDPMFCWTITKTTEQPLPGGNGTVLRVVEEGHEKDVLFWFTDRVHKHSSPARYWLQASWRRATLGKLGAEQVLLIVEPLDSGPVNWFRVLDGLPWLLDL
jgi:exosortase/archaeosortase family protein